MRNERGVDGMKKRLGAGALALLLTAALVSTGCSGQVGQRGGQQQGGTQEKIGKVSVIGVWGSTELENFQKVAKGWEDSTGGTMEFEGTRDLSPILRARVQGGNPPDVAILPNPAMLDQFKDQLTPLDGVVDKNQLSQDYSQDWIEEGTVDNKLLGIVVKASPKSTVWYDPKRFSEAGYQTPTSWDELVSLTKQIRDDGKAAPWSMGMEAGGASGWPGSDWIQEIYLAENGADKYDQWVNHEIPWTDPTVKSAFEKFGEIANTKGNVAGGSQAIVSTNFEDAAYPPFQNPPKAYMYFLGAFTQGFIEAQFKDLKATQDYDFFDFPSINGSTGGASTGGTDSTGTAGGTGSASTTGTAGTMGASSATVGGDTIVMFNDTPSARSLVKYLATGDAWMPWVEAGGYTTPNKSVDINSYPDPLAQKAAQQLTEANPVRFDADDMMPPEVQQAEWKGILEYIQSPDKLDSILKDIEATAKDAYANKQ